MIDENANRFRVTSKYTIQKVVIYLLFIGFLFNIFRESKEDSLTSKSVTIYLITVIALVVILRILSTRKTIEYDDIKHILYVFNSKGQFETEIHVKAIDHILYSSIGIGRGDHNYLILYRDQITQEQKKVRLYPIPFQNDIDVIITDTKIENPDVTIRKWSFGWN